MLVTNLVCIAGKTNEVAVRTPLVLKIIEDKVLQRAEQRRFIARAARKRFALSFSITNAIVIIKTVETDAESAIPR